MERNDAGINNGAGDVQGDANEFSGSPSTSQQEASAASGASGASGASSAGGPDAGFDFAGTSSTSDKHGIRDRAKNAIGTAGEKLVDVGSTVRERAATAKDKLADALESGAERLRDRTQAGSGATLAGATADGSASIQADGRIAQVSDKVAGGMDATAEWLRDADLDGLKTGLERQVKEHPGRTLLIAAGLGYLIGRAFRNNQ
jgi:ElaB/YqjD/DUF883 family membrane-anchored ribosome-binding protein